MSGAIFVSALLNEVPALRPIYEAHLQNNDELLPHVFMGDVARFAIRLSNNNSCKEELARLCDCLERGLEQGEEDVQELIIVSFVENLIGERGPIRIIKTLSGPKLRSAIDDICNDPL